MNKEETWISLLQQISQLQGSPINQHDGKWSIKERKEVWAKVAPQIFDNHLERLHKVVVEVFREKDPQFELKPEIRYAAAAHGKIHKYSQSLRTGLAQTLALIATNTEALKSCSIGKPEATVNLAIREILTDADAVLWASLSEYLPTFAEAAPEVFLSAVDTALRSPARPFKDVFAQESTGITGRTYTTGLLWGLEALAWNKDYFSRAILLLGALAEIDPGGNWANRPINSIIDILLPWHPQTLANIELRKTTVGLLVRECPQTAWKVLLALLPSSHGATSGSYKPQWRNYIPEDWKEKVSHSDYWAQIDNYSKDVISFVKADLSKLPDAISHLTKLPPDSFNEAIQFLGSNQVTSLSPEERQPIWEKLITIVVEHRRFSDADWAKPEAILTQIEDIANKLKPNDIILTSRRLFSEREIGLYEAKGNYEQQSQILTDRRKIAIGQILDSKGIETVVSFAHQVGSPDKVGAILGLLGKQAADEYLLPKHLASNDPIISRLVTGYIRSRFYSAGWAWADSCRKEWSPEQKLEFLLLIPFGKECWEKAGTELGALTSKYWERVEAYRVENDKDFPEAVKKLISNQRPAAAVWLLGQMLHLKIDIATDLVVQAIEGQLYSKEGNPRFDRHDTLELIAWLQDREDLSDEALARIEWGYLPLLGSLNEVEPKALGRNLARDPKFYCEVIRTAFKSKTAKTEAKEPSEEKAQLAQRAYELLREWKQIPGNLGDKFNPDDFRKWLSEVKSLSQKTGHYEVAMHIFGQVLAYAPEDPSGLWIHKDIAAALDSADAEELRSGYRIKSFNMRGVHGYTAGKEEQEISDGYQNKSDSLIQHGYPRFAATLKALAESYKLDAKRQSLRTPFE